MNARAYRRLFDTALTEIEIDLIRHAAHYSTPIGDDRFRREIEAAFSLEPNYSKRGRPIKNLVTVTG